MRDALAELPAEAARDSITSAFVETCLETVAGPAAAAARRNGRRPHAARLLKVLAGKRNILVTTHMHPDPDALASSLGMVHLLRAKLPPEVSVGMSIKGRVGGGVNTAFAELSKLSLVPWDDATIDQYDAVILLDTQPQSAYSPLPKSVTPAAVIDHHRGGPAKQTKCSFCDIRTAVGATSSIIFSYFMELDLKLTPLLAASLLFAIESDLAGAAGEPGELDNLALSSLTLLADTHKLYRMRYVDLPQSYYVSYAAALANAVHFEGPPGAIVSHVGTIDSLEKPAVMADFLLRLETVQWSLVTAVHENRLILSLRTRSATLSAVDVVRKITRDLGQGGGHQLKAGGFVDLKTGSQDEVATVHDTLRRRLLLALHVKAAAGKRLVPPPIGI